MSFKEYINSSLDDNETGDVGDARYFSTQVVFHLASQNGTGWDCLAWEQMSNLQSEYR